MVDGEQQRLCSADKLYFHRNCRTNPEQPEKEQFEMEDKTHIWTYGPISDFDIPSPPASDVAHGEALRLRKLIQRIFTQPKKNTAPEKPQWDSLPVDLLRSISPDPDWEQAALELADALGEDWFENRQPRRPIRVFVAAPGCQIPETLRSLAQHRQLSLLTAPSLNSLLEASASNTSALNAVVDSSSEILVVPRLERWYLRHEDGLTMVRNLLERLITLRKRVLLGCDSWAWAFLQKTIGVEDMLGEPQTLAAFDAIRLDGWFRSICEFQGYEFRQSGDGEPVFPNVPIVDGDNHQQPKPKRSLLLASLAAKARGNPGVALALFRACLRTLNTDGDTKLPNTTADESIVWVVSPSSLSPPDLPADVDRMHRFVLHSILLHGGLSPSLLDTVLPFSRDDIQRRVSGLLRAGVLEEQDGKLRVPFMAYPAVRRDLQSEGFLTDAF